MNEEDETKNDFSDDEKTGGSAEDALQAAQNLLASAGNSDVPKTIKAVAVTAGGSSG